MLNRTEIDGDDSRFRTCYRLYCCYYGGKTQAQTIKNSSTQPTKLSHEIKILGKLIERKIRATTLSSNNSSWLPCQVVMIAMPGRHHHRFTHHSIIFPCMHPPKHAPTTCTPWSANKSVSSKIGQALHDLWYITIKICLCVCLHSVS